MRKLVFLLPLLLAACGTVTPMAPDAQREGQTFQQALQEPGWTEVAPQYWERATDSGTETIYIGLSGARAALKAREADLARLPQSGSDQVKAIQAEITSLRAYVTSTPGDRVEAQIVSAGDCRYSASVMPTSSMPGIKANAWIYCSKERYPQATANVTVNGEYVEADDSMAGPTSDSASASLGDPAATRCSGSASATATVDGTRVGIYASGSRCK